MWIVVLLLKIIGTILLAILLIALLILCYLLFAPITYRAKAGYVDKGSVSVAVYDLFRIVKYTFTYEDKAQYHNVDIVWGLFHKGEKKKAEEDEEDKNEDSLDGVSIIDDLEKDELYLEDEDYTDPSQWDDDESEESLPAVRQSTETEDREDSSAVDSEMQEEPESEEPQEDIPEDDTEDDFGDEESEEDEDEGALASVNKYKDMLTDKRNHEAVKYLLKKVFRLLYHIRPHIRKADLDFATGAPDLTGKIVGAVAVWPGAYGKGKRITPDFVSDDPYAKGFIDIYGKVVLWYPLLYAIQVILNKDCRRLYKQIK